MFEGAAVRVLQSSRSITQACELLRLDWSGAHRIMERAVERGLERRNVEEVRYIGMNEKSFIRGQSYVSTLVDHNKKAPHVLEVSAGRDVHAAKELLGSLPKSKREKIEAVVHGHERIVRFGHARGMTESRYRARPLSRLQAAGRSGGQSEAGRAQHRSLEEL